MIRSPESELTAAGVQQLNCFLFFSLVQFTKKKPGKPRRRVLLFYFNISRSKSSFLKNFSFTDLINSLAINVS